MNENETPAVEQPAIPENGAADQQANMLSPDEVQAYLDELTAELNESAAQRRLLAVRLRSALATIDRQNTAINAATAEIAELKAGKRSKK